MSPSGTVIAAELRGFISLAEPILPEQAAAVLDAFYHTFAQAANTNGAGLVTFRGPTALAAWEPTGTPEAGALAAADTARLLAAAQTSSPHPSLPPLPHHVRFGIGIATGPIFIGPLGPGPGWRDMVGDTVNTAIMLAGVASATEIVITEATREALGGQASMLDAGLLTRHGKPTPVRVYRLLPDEVLPDDA